MIEIQDDNVATAFRNVVRVYPDFPAITSPSGSLSYCQLLSLVVSFADKMKENGVGRSSLVAIYTGDLVVSVSTLLASSLLGCRFVVASQELADSEIDRPTNFFKSSEAIGRRGVPFVEIDESWMPSTLTDPQSSLDRFEGYAASDDPWLLMHTSGTTGRPKYLSLSQQAVMRRTHAVADDFPKAQTTMVSLFGPTSRPFFARSIAALFNACTIVDSPDTAFWAKAGVNLVFGSPRQLGLFFDKVQVVTPIARLEVSGAKLTDAMAQKLAPHFGAITDVYGASETSKSFAHEITIDENNSVHRVGVPLDSEIEIVREDNTLCDPAEAGVVRIRNPYMAPGYMNAADATEKAFRNGWFYPGDTAHWGPNGALVISARSDDVISIGGVKILAELVDISIKMIPGVKDAACFANPKPGIRDEIVAFVVFDELTKRDFCVAQIREKYQNTLKLPCFLGAIHGIDDIPYGEENTPMRNVCQQMVLEQSEKLKQTYPS